MKKECTIKFPKIFQVEPISVICEAYYSEKRIEIIFDPSRNADLYNIISNWMKQITSPRITDYDRSSKYKGSLIVEGMCITEGLFPVSAYWMENPIVRIEFSYDAIMLDALVTPEPESLEMPIKEGIDYEKDLAVEWDLEFEKLKKETA
jgi:hypothetical protein